MGLKYLPGGLVQRDRLGNAKGTSIGLSFDNEYPSCYLHGMPRKARLDAPGALHHIVVRGIERRKIFYDDIDRDDFLERLSAILCDCRTACYAWALMPNHFHLLLKTGQTPKATRARWPRAAISAAGPTGGLPSPP